MARGKLIVIEGCNSSGKKTQSTLLVKKLNLLGINAINLSFPMYKTPTGRIIEEAFLGKTDKGSSWFKEGYIKVDPKIACLYYAADRKYNFDIIEDYLEKGYYVVLNRYVSSNMGHQGAKIDDPDLRFELFGWIDKLEYWLLKLPKPDKTILLHLPYKYRKDEVSKRKDLDDDEKSEEYQVNSVKTYLELASLYNWDLVDCVKDDKVRDVEDINKEILDIILKNSDLKLDEIM